jgi:hypothetical protein
LLADIIVLAGTFKEKEPSGLGKGVFPECSFFSK